MSPVAFTHIWNVFGQKLNLENIELLFSRNVSQEDVSDIKSIWDVQSVQYHAKYLGLPSFVGRNKKNTFKDLKTRIWNKLQGWKEKLLS